MKKTQLAYIVIFLSVTGILSWLKMWLLLIGILVGIVFLIRKGNYRKIKSRLSAYPVFVRRILEWAFILVVSAAIVVFIKTYIFDVFRLPSNSMAKTVENGDLVFINKLVMGPRLNPNNLNSYWRAKGLGFLKTNDLLAFNFPEGDTLLMNNPEESYYALKRHYKQSGEPRRQSIWTNKKFKKVNRRPKYIKRLIGLPGDTVKITDGNIFVNGVRLDQPDQVIYKYKSTISNPDSLLNAEKITPFNQYYHKKDRIYELEDREMEHNLSLQKGFTRFIIDRNVPDPNIFPYVNYWNVDQLGPLVVPKKGVTIDIDTENIGLYSRIIDIYEENDFKTAGGDIFINGKKVTQYTFKMDYYWVLGDNRPHSFDSRYWGFLPENHIIGVSRMHINLP